MNEWLAIALSGPGLFTLGAFDTEADAKACADTHLYTHKYVIKIDSGRKERYHGMIHAYADNTCELNPPLKRVDCVFPTAGRIGQ